MFREPGALAFTDLRDGRTVAIPTIPPKRWSGSEDWTHVRRLGRSGVCSATLTERMRLYPRHAKRHRLREP